MNAVTYYSEAIKKVDSGEITIGEYERMINVLRDVEPVVRCRDCKHNPLETWFDCPLSHLKYDGERWCWKGERKDGNDD